MVATASTVSRGPAALVSDSLARSVLRSARSTVANRQSSVRVDAVRLRRAIDRALAAVGRPRGMVDLAIVDDHEIRRLNARHRGIRRRTDVLAFPLEIEGTPGRLIGQIVISAETALRQAQRIGVPVATELDLLVTHGVLHLVGWDDRDPVEAHLMHRRERQILAQRGGRAPERLWSDLLHRAKKPSRRGAAIPTPARP